MADIKWIKIKTDMFEDEKIKLIDALPERDTIHYIWLRLLVQAGKTNASGYIFLNENVPYTEEMLSTIFCRPLNSIRLALSTLSNFGMIEIKEDKIIKITNWEKHQNVEGMERVREQGRIRAQRKREKDKLLKEKSEKLVPTNDENNVTEIESNVTVTECNNLCNGYSNVTVTECNATDKNKNKNKNENNIREDKNRILYQQIIDLFHETCVSFSKITALSEKRKKMINARLNTYGIEKITEVFKKAESSDFLKGKNTRDWKANFDWIMNDSNFAKILDGNYDNKTSQPVTENKLYQDNFDHNFLEALTRKRNFK